MRTGYPLAIVGLVVALGLAGLVFAAGGQNTGPVVEWGTDDTAAPRLLAAFGDTDVNRRAVRNVRLAVAAGSQGYLGLGDYAYYAGASAWQVQMRPLIRHGCLCVLGNHDKRTAYVGLFPGRRSPWSVAVAGVRVIGLDTKGTLREGSEQWDWLVQELERAREAVKVVVLHQPWWLTAGAASPASKFPGSPEAMEALMARHGVALVLAGHEHNYQRSVRNGVSYVIVGTGGRSLHPLAGLAEGTVATYRGYGHLLLRLSPTGIDARFVSLAGSVEDTFTIGPPARPVGAR